MSITRLISVLIPLVALQCQVISTEDCPTFVLLIKCLLVWFTYLK